MLIIFLIAVLPCFYNIMVRPVFVYIIASVPECCRNTRDLFKSRSPSLEISRQAAASIESNTLQVEGAVSCPKVCLELQTFQRRNPKKKGNNSHNRSGRDTERKERSGNFQNDSFYKKTSS